MDIALDELGPVDYLVVEFPAGHTNFSGEGARELARLIESETIRVLDVLILTKNADGKVDATEINDVDEVDELRTLETELAELLSLNDITNLAESMEPGTTAAALVYENRWAAPFASALRRAGGQLVADGRIPIQAILASLEAEDAPVSEGA
jgi:hypothetical protein